MTVRDLLSEALEELGVVQQGDTLSDNDADTALRRYNRLLDAWNATRAAVYADDFTTYTLTPSLDPHTIGPAGTFVVAQRPVSLEGASLWLSASTPDSKRPITVRDAAWFNGLQTPTLSTSYPTDVFYDPRWPAGQLHFYPVPDAAYNVELWTRIVLAQVGLATTFTLPPGYHRMHVLTLAEECASAFNTQPSPKLVADAATARGVIFGNNTKTPYLRTKDAGMATRGGGRSYNYLDRSGI